jgi:hypothetical protein
MGSTAKLLIRGFPKRFIIHFHQILYVNWRKKMSTSVTEQHEMAVLDLIAIGHVTSGTIAFTLIYYPFVFLFKINSAIMIGWAFFMALIVNRVYTGIETKILKVLNFKVQRDGTPAVVFLTVLTLIGSIIALAMSYFWINLIVIGVEGTGFYLLYTVLRQNQNIPIRKKVNVKRLAKQFAKVHA